MIPVRIIIRQILLSLLIKAIEIQIYKKNKQV